MKNFFLNLMLSFMVISIFSCESETTKPAFETEIFAFSRDYSPPNESMQRSTANDVTSVLNAQLPGDPGVLMLGCCNEDGLNPDGTNEDLCNDFTEYIAYGDITLKRSELIIRKANLTIVDGNLITNGAEINFTCGGSITFEGRGDIVNNPEEANRGLDGCQGNLIPVCLNGNTLCVSPQGLGGMLDAGATEGSCQTLSNGPNFRYGISRPVQIPIEIELPHYFSRDNRNFIYTESRIN